ncbi:hypothetical protein CDBH8_1062 [Corynebacterium diphtheriae BH8]|nr:hypothetical protein CDBH8_1062 [Corynebacterium diphtheriae BH8]AEX67199.1 hypothetical protein CDC7B_1003 [Corynebacterium diphtheriae C7 (beta)]AEX69714.1 hypothetical protein CDPW8_1059 [Corynebacterium diphtheriae PW8]
MQHRTAAWESGENPELTRSGEGASECFNVATESKNSWEGEAITLA